MEKVGGRMLINKKLLGNEEIRTKFVNLVRDNKFQDLFVAMIDINNMKAINDNPDLGHLIGNNVISRFSHILANNTEDKDFLFHFGGDEFCLFLLDRSEKDTRKLIEKIKLAILNDKYLMEEIGGVSASIGVVQYSPRIHTSVEKVVDDADVCLYAAKTSQHLVVFKNDPIDVSREANKRRNDILYKQLREYYKSMIKIVKLQYPEVHDDTLREAARNTWRLNGRKLLNLGTPIEVVDKIMGEYKRILIQLKREFQKPKQEEA